jgi:hypothetical protein
MTSICLQLLTSLVTRKVCTMQELSCTNAFISNTKISNHDINVFKTALAHSFYREKQSLSTKGP